MLIKNPEYRAILNHLLAIVGVIFLSRITRNYAIIGLAAYGIVMCLRRDVGKAITVYLLLSLLPMINPMIMPRYSHFAMIARLSSLLMTTALIITGSNRQGGHMLPLGAIFPYLAVAAISSTIGYCPTVSYLKIFNFIVFISGIYLGARNLHLRLEDIEEIRYTLLAIVVLIVYGSLMTLPFPSTAYFISARKLLFEYGIKETDAILAESDKLLFTGITVHSQFLGPMVALCFGWVICDMWLIKQNIDKLHVILLAPIPVIAYMTRSRIALVTFVCTAIATTILCMPRVKLSVKTKRQFRYASIVAMVAFIIMAVTYEVKNQSITKWIRKSDNLIDDTRTLNEAFTESRQGKIDSNLFDFRRNYLFGSGFQVDVNTQADLKAGKVSIFSAPIEKSVLPLMILGETGIIGAVFFIVFLLSFFMQCRTRKYFATSSMFVAYLSTNLAEATFFAPSGGGGVEWIFCVVGGFALDMYRRTNNMLPMQIVTCQNIESQYEDGEIGDDEPSLNTVQEI